MFVLLFPLLFLGSRATIMIIITTITIIAIIIPHAVELPPAAFPGAVVVAAFVVVGALVVTAAVVAAVVPGIVAAVVPDVTSTVVVSVAVADTGKNAADSVSWTSTSIRAAKTYAADLIVFFIYIIILSMGDCFVCSCFAA